MSDAPEEVYLTIPYRITRYGDGDLYIQMDGTNAGRPFMTRPNSGNYYAVTVNPDVFDAKYFFYTVQYLHSAGKFHKYLHGVTVQHLTIPNFHSVIHDHFMEMSKKAK